MNFRFFIVNILLGIALAMDAFSVSVANGIHEPKMNKQKSTLIATTFAIFQAIMPFIGWICVHTIINIFESFSKFIPCIALILLSLLGTKMIIDTITNKEEQKVAVGFIGLLIQGIATSIDALSVGFTIANYNLIESLVACGVIALVTLIICLLGVYIGKHFGNKFSKAEIVGGIILILIGLEIFLSNIL